MEGKVVKIVNDLTIAINFGSKDNVKKNDVFIIFEKQEEIFDPDTNESLGYLEVPKLKMKVLNIQENLTLLESDETQDITDKKIERKIKRKTKGNDSTRKLFGYANFDYFLNNNDDEEETIIEEKPKVVRIKVTEKDIKVGDIARKMN